MKNILIKALLMVLSVAAVFAASLFGTVAYFTADQSVQIDFTVGQVNVVTFDPYGGSVSTMMFGGPATPTPTKIVPGTPVPIEPIVMLGEGSESAYIRILVTFKGVAALDKVYGAFTADELFNTEISGSWINSLYSENTEADTRTFEFRYITPVEARDGDESLLPPFTTMTFAGDNFRGADRDEIEEMFANLSISIVSQAIQTEGFADADEAWAAYPEQ